ncbi:leguminosin proline-rich group669 secreted peptide [Trifolium medium]|uniref:Leguminosin proline-rich group669 secreted peptide n=1 Tax=Trifolium medium TaxID=97028 RepID=A0A392QGJ8_9FABA|nr:leguminosin proline-rich group669 secreted peptide [Trifolium medium]
MSFLSLLVLFLAVINLTNIAGNPKQQIDAQPNGLINNQSPTIEPHTSSLRTPKPPPPPARPPPVSVPPVPHIQPPGPRRPPPRSLR